jgi:flagellar biosynthesis/type III secretory pathway protein FliH
MGAVKLADLLPDFARQTRTGDAAAGLGGDVGAADVLEPLAARAPQPAGPSLEERIAQAEEALRAALAAEHEAELSALRERHAGEIGALKVELGEKAGAVIAARFAEMESRVVELATSVTARILGVTLTEDLQRRAVEALAHTVREAVKDSDAVRVRVSGPPLLFEALRKAAGEAAEQLDFTEGDGFDLTVIIGESLFETRLSEWSEALAEVLS